MRKMTIKRKRRRERRTSVRMRMRGGGGKGKGEGYFPSHSIFPVKCFVISEKLKIIDNC